MMQLILRFFDRAAPRVQNEAVAVSQQRAIVHEDIYGNKTTVFESTTWSGTEGAAPFMFQQQPAQQQQFLPAQNNHQTQAQRRVPYQQPAIEGQRRVTAGRPLVGRPDYESWDQGQ
jgi:hypothetical protein